MDVKELVKTWFSIWEEGNFKDIPVAEDFTHTSPYGTIKGKKAYLALVEANKDKFLGYRFEIHDELYADDRGCIWYTAIQGDFRLQVSEWHYIQKGKIQEIVAHYNIEGEISEARQLSTPS